MSTRSTRGGHTSNTRTTHGKHAPWHTLTTEEKLREAGSDPWDQLFIILDDLSEAYVVYVYRLDQQRKPITPYLLKTEPYPQLLEFLRDHHGGGEFRIMVRRGREMALRGDFSIVTRSERRL